jgi:hypothetical protein
LTGVSSSSALTFSVPTGACRPVIETNFEAALGNQENPKPFGKFPEKPSKARRRNGFHDVNGCGNVGEFHMGGFLADFQSRNSSNKLMFSKIPCNCASRLR